MDETDIPFVRLGQPGEGDDRRAAGPDVSREGHRGGNSPIQATGRRRATNSRWSTIDGVVPNVRPGFTCTSVITTRRVVVLSVPIQATTVREMILDDMGQVETAASRQGKTAPKTTVSA